MKAQAFLDDHDAPIDGTRPLTTFADACDPQTILALLDSLPSPVSVPEGDAREIAARIAREIVERIRTPLFAEPAESQRRQQVITSALLSAESRGERRMRERAAQIVEDGQETHSSKNESYFLTPRKPGNSAGLVYASAIRKLSLSSPEEG